MNSKAIPVASQIAAIRDILSRHGRLRIDLATLASDTNLHDVGLSSLATVAVMLALEEHFDVEFSDAMLARKTFQSLESIAEAVAKLTGRT